MRRLSLLLLAGLLAASAFAQERTFCSGPPDRPRNLVVRPGSTTIELQWEATRCTDAYIVTVTQMGPARGASAPAPRTFGASTVKVTIDGLQPSTQYSIAVVAQNSRGSSPAATATATTSGGGPRPPPACVASINPGMPLGLNAVAESHERIRVAWRAPVFPSSACLEGYKIEAFEAATGRRVHSESVMPSITSTAFSFGLKPNTRYQVKVRSQGRNGGSWDAITFVNTKRAPGPSCRPMRPLPPTNVQSTVAAPDRIKLTWANGSPDICVSDYAVEGFEVKSGKRVLSMSTVAADATATMLTPGLEYRFLISARGQGGTSPSTQYITFLPGTGPAGCQDTVPPQVRDFTAQPGGPGRLNLEWKAPRDACISEYVLRVRETGERFVVPPSGDKQRGKFAYQAAAGRAGSSFNFEVTAFSAPSKKQGVTASFGPFLTAGPRR